MSKKNFNYIIVGLLAVLLALFVGIFLGNRNNSTNNNNSYTPPTVEDNRDDGSIYNPDLGTVEDNENYTGEKYFLMPNNSSYGNYDYFVNTNGIDLNNIDMQFLAEMFKATYTSDLSASNFITVGRLDGDQSHSSLVYIKFSTYLGKFNGNDLVSTTPALITFGYEQTVTNEYHLRYAFCTYGDRGEVYSAYAPMYSFDGDVFSNIKLRVPYLLSSDYNEVVHLFTLSGLTKDGYTYKLLNEESDQYYIESDALTIISRLTENIIYKHLSSANSIIMDDIDLSNYIKVNGVDYDYVLAYYSYNKNPVSLTNFYSKSGKLLSGYFTVGDDSSVMGWNPIYKWLNNDEAIYSIPLVDIVV